LNLTTHLFFGVAVGFIFFGQPEIALLVTLGALLPDLDREYWFMGSQKYRDEQYHRALFHNIFVMAAVYLTSPFVSLGMFLHVFQDSFTTMKDRGCEWLYPVTRRIKRGIKDANGKDEPLDPKEHVYFYQEDPKGLLENADEDLREPGDKPVPWRRTYGPAQNGQLLDQGFLLGSIALVIIWLLEPGTSHGNDLLAFFTQNWFSCLIGFGSIALIFAAGELDRKGKVTSSRMRALVRVTSIPLFAGIILGAYSIFSHVTEIRTNFEAVSNNALQILLGIIAVGLVSVILIKWQTRAERSATV
jgi:hypothetical protein